MSHGRRTRPTDRYLTTGPFFIETILDRLVGRAAIACIARASERVARWSTDEWSSPVLVVSKMMRAAPLLRSEQRSADRIGQEAGVGCWYAWPACVCC